MIPTEEWMKEKFILFNNTYFNNKIPRPKFKAKEMTNNLGQYIPNIMYNSLTRNVTRIKDAGVIILSTSFDRNEQELCSTLLHEMIHEYIVIVDRKYPKNVHGKEFLSLADKIKNYGYNVNDVSQTQLRNINNNNDSDNESYLGILETPISKNWKFWAFKVDMNKKNEFATTLSKIQAPKNIYYYICYSPKFKNEVADPNTLKGFGGNTFQEVLEKMNNYYGGNYFSQENLKQYNL